MSTVFYAPLAVIQSVVYELLRRYDAGEQWIFVQEAPVIRDYDAEEAQNSQYQIHRHTGERIVSISRREEKVWEFFPNVSRRGYWKTQPVDPVVIRRKETGTATFAEIWTALAALPIGDEVAV